MPSLPFGHKSVYTSTDETTNVITTTESVITMVGKLVDSTTGVYKDYGTSLAADCEKAVVAVNKCGKAMQNTAAGAVMEDVSKRLQLASSVHRQYVQSLNSNVVEPLKALKGGACREASDQIAAFNRAKKAVNAAYSKYKGRQEQTDKKEIYEAALSEAEAVEAKTNEVLAAFLTKCEEELKRVAEKMAEATRTQSAGTKKALTS